MRQNTFLSILTLLIALTVAPGAFSEDASRYEELVQSPGAAKTIQNFALLVLATPVNREVVEEKLKPIWWANNPMLKMDAAERKLAMSELTVQLDAVEKAVVRHEISRLELAGFSLVGTQRCMDFYYAADTARGPVVFRLSVSFENAPRPSLHGITVIQGFEKVRQAEAEIQHRAGKRVASYTAEPKGKEQDEPGDNAS